MAFSILDIQFGRTEPDYPGPVQCSGPDQYGIPLTIAEAGRLADSLAVIDRLSYTSPVRASGIPWVRQLVNDVAGYVGGAKVRGYTYVPFPLDRLDTVGRALEVGMEMDPGSADLALLETLVRRMHVLGGMARMGGWVLNSAVNGMAWLNDEPSRDALGHGDADEVAVIA